MKRPRATQTPLLRFLPMLSAMLVVVSIAACGDNDDPVTDTTDTTDTTATAGDSSESNNESNNESSTPGVVVSGAASTADVACTYTYSEFNTNAWVNDTSTVAWSCDDTQRMLTANGIPDHDAGPFIEAQNQTILPQDVSATFSLEPAYDGTATPLGGPAGVVAFMLNGVKADPGTGGSCDDSGAICSPADPSGNWSIEALTQPYFFSTDDSNAHIQPGGLYHYHGMPEGLVAKLSGGNVAMTLIGWAADGFPVYARYGYTDAADATSPIKVMTGSYQLVETVPDNRPDTDTYLLGTFRQDWEFVAGSGDLDECNGRTGVT
ncbi:MAG: YHYH protein, partial [Burkholderiaceae bacterium]